MGRAQKLEPGLTHITVRGANMISIATPLSRRGVSPREARTYRCRGKVGKKLYAHGERKEPPAIGNRDLMPERRLGTLP